MGGKKVNKGPLARRSGHGGRTGLEVAGLECRQKPRGKGQRPDRAALGAGRGTSDFIPKASGEAWTVP